jgi:hypothetical protein
MEGYRRSKAGIRVSGHSSTTEVLACAWIPGAFEEDEEILAPLLDAGKQLLKKP